MKKMLFTLVLATIAAITCSAAEISSLPTTTNVSSPSWPVEVQFPVHSWPYQTYPENQDSSTKEKRHPAER